MTTIVLISGNACSGKSTVGNLISSKLRSPFFPVAHVEIYRVMKELASAISNKPIAELESLHQSCSSTVVGDFNGKQLSATALYHEIEVYFRSRFLYNKCVLEKSLEDVAASKSVIVALSGLRTVSDYGRITASGNRIYHLHVDAPFLPSAASVGIALDAEQQELRSLSDWQVTNPIGDPDSTSVATMATLVKNVDSFLGSTNIL